MKKYFISQLFCIVCLFSIQTRAQVTNSGLSKNHVQAMDSLLLYVNKQPINTGILYDRVMSFSNLDFLKDNGVTTKSNYEHFLQSWSEIYRAAYSPSFMNVESLKTVVNNTTNSNIVDIGIINTKINYIDYGSTAYPTLNFSNGYLQNIGTLSPFIEKQITIIAALKETVTAGNVIFRLQPSLILQLLGNKIKTLQADFGTGAIYNLITNQNITTTNPIITFATSGEKEFIYYATFEDNSTQTLKSKILVNIVAPTVVLRSGTFPLEEDFVGTDAITATIPFQGYNESVATLGNLEYRTYYNRLTNDGSAKSKIMKPVIILDGFDPGDGRKIYPGSINYKSDKSSLEELMLFIDQTGVTRNLVEKIRAAPYFFDATLVNFPNGADYVERNAMALVALLQRENAKLAINGSTEQISIVGPSMGGLVARYALAYMEKNNIPHNTKLFVSFDCPNLGANIPIAAQETLYFYGYKGGKDKAKEKFDLNFRSPAARQMLTEQLDYNHENAPYPTDLMRNGIIPTGQNDWTPFRIQFLDKLTNNGISGSNGFPMNLRKVSIINGTSTGAKTNSEDQMFLELAAFKKIKYGLILGIGGTLLTHNPLWLLATPLSTDLKVATMEDRFLSYPNGINQTFAGKITLKTGWNNNFIKVINSTVVRTNYNQRGTMDIVPGGKFNTAEIIKLQFEEQLNGEVDKQEWRQYVPNHAFIPSVSALAFKNPNFDWSTAFMRNLVCNPANREIPFDSYFVPATNEDHVKVTAENANWLIQELQGINQLPYFPMESNLLIGDNLICENQLKTYIINETCKVPGAPVWSVSGNLQIVSSTPFSVTVKGLSNSPSEGKIIATFHSFVGGQKIEKPVHIGAPSVSNIQIGGTFDWVSTFSGSVGIGVAPDPTISSYIWSVAYDPIDSPITCPAVNPRKAKFQGGTTVGFVNSLATTSPNASIDYGNCVGSYIVTCTAINACGSTDYIQKETFVGPPSSNPCTHPKTGLKLSIAPNPVKDGQINVSLSRTIDMVPCNYLNNGNKQALKLNPIEEVIENKALIYDLFGNLVYSKTFITDEFTLTDINLKRGHYILNVFTSKGESSKQVIIVE
jgi:Putative serine esterase (DUF676)